MPRFISLKSSEKYPLTNLFVNTDDEDVDIPDEQPSSHRLATSMGVDARNMQVMKASFFGDEDAPVPAFGKFQ